MVGFLPNHIIIIGKKYYPTTHRSYKLIKVLSSKSSISYVVWSQVTFQ